MRIAGMTSTTARPATFPAVAFADPDPYQAGACNIGPAEIARRRRAGVAGVVVSLLLALVLVALDVPSAARLLVAVPLAGGLIALEQARRRFCVAFAMAGLRNFGELGRADAVTDARDRSADRRAVVGLVAPATLAAVAIAAVFVLLPV